MSGVMVSLAGEAVIRLPAMVPRLRICGAPTSHAARASGYARLRMSFDAAQSLCVTSAPRWMTSSSSMLIWFEVGDARDVDQGFDALADAAFEFEDEVGAAGDDAGAFPFYRPERG
jgi:hypothetical protein